MGAGAFRDRVLFQRLDATEDEYGNVTDNTWADLFPKVRCNLRLQRGRERLEAGRLEDSVPGIIKVRRSTETLQVTTEDRAVIKGIAYQIRTIADVDRRNRYLEMTVERGVAT